MERSINQKCFFGLPYCGFGFESSRHCFVASPSDPECQLELDLIKKELDKSNYEAYIAVENFTGGKNIFCQKICSKIITAHFCIAILNESTHKEDKHITIPNPNVHFEYGLMCALNKRVIPMMIEGKKLPFNVAPLDTIIYSKSTFTSQLTKHTSESIMAIQATESDPLTGSMDRQVFEFMSLRGLVLADITPTSFNKAVYDLGGYLGFLLFFGGIYAFFLIAEKSDDTTIAFNIKLLTKNIRSFIIRLCKQSSKRSAMEIVTEVDPLVSSLNGLQIYVLVDQVANREWLEKFCKGLENSGGLEVRFITRKELLDEVESEKAAIKM
jgi:hypothetical protein